MAEDPSAYNCRQCPNQTRAAPTRACRYPLRPRNLAPRIRELMADGLSVQDIRATLVEEGYGHPLQAVAAWVERLPKEPKLELPGDGSLSVEAEARYPGAAPVQCPRYELPWWAAEAVRAYSYAQNGQAGMDDRDGWMDQAIEVVGAEYARLTRERMPKPGAGAHG